MHGNCTQLSEFHLIKQFRQPELISLDFTILALLILITEADPDTDPFEQKFPHHLKTSLSLKHVSSCLS